MTADGVRAPGTRLRVLVCDGDPDHEALLQRTLQDAEFRVEACASFAAVREIALTQAHDALVLSERLRDGNGVELLETLRVDGLRTPVIMLTSRGEGGCRAALRAGASDVMDKLAGFELLLPALVRQAVIRHQAGLEARDDHAKTLVRLEAAERRLALLETALDAKEGELQEANRRAAEANLQRNQLLANVSHELRTPLTTIIGFTGVLLDRASGPLTMEQAKQLDLIQKAASQLLALINDLLDITRLEAGLTEVVRLPVDLFALCLEVRQAVVPLVGEKPVEVRVTGEPLLVQSDPSKLRQILWNVCVNAARTTQQGVVELSVESLGAGARISVKDTSEGLPPDELARVFEKFAPTTGGKRRPRTQSAGGTSLGLALAFDLAQALGGKLSVSSVVGTGTVFSLDLAG